MTILICLVIVLLGVLLFFMSLLLFEDDIAHLFFRHDGKKCRKAIENHQLLDKETLRLIKGYGLPSYLFMKQVLQVEAYQVFFWFLKDVDPKLPSKYLKNKMLDSHARIFPYHEEELMLKQIFLNQNYSIDSLLRFRWTFDFERPIYGNKLKWQDIRQMWENFVQYGMKEDGKRYNDQIQEFINKMTNKTA